MPFIEAYSIFRGDDAPALAAILRKDGKAVDLSTASMVEIGFFKKSGDLWEDAIFQVTSDSFASQGLVLYNWKAGDLATIGKGLKYVRYRVTWADGEIETYPDPLHADDSFIVVG
jgi:hypothetical protein